MRSVHFALPLMLVALTASQSQQPAPPRVSPFGNTVGYLPAGAAPDGTLLLPAPPAPGSAAQARDDAAAQAAIALKGSPRWDQAIRDVELRFPAAMFACALGFEPAQRNEPRLDVLLRRTMVDVARATSSAKRKYQRSRPFMVNAAPLCTPDQESILRNDGSYPSGHSAIGWGLALVLSELAPERADPLLARGRAFGQSRVVCNVHWLSDVEEGRLLASATVAKLHAMPEFRSDLEAARAEFASLRAGNRRPAEARCSTERAALGSN